MHMEVEYVILKLFLSQMLNYVLIEFISINDILLLMCIVYDSQIVNKRFVKTFFVVPQSSNFGIL